MTIRKSLFIIPLVAIAVITTACNPGPASNPEDDIPTSEYDSNWTPGENAIEGAKQPSIKNPVGELSVLNKMRFSQKRNGIPSKGKANILVVPITFKDDDLIASQTSLDLTFSDSDIAKIENLYFADNADVIETMPSVKSYYEISSYGKLSLDGVVSPVVSYPTSYYDTLLKVLNSGVEQVRSEIVEYVYNYLFEETQTYYVGDFDADKDGRVDAISILLNYPYGYIYGEDANESLANLVFAGPNNVGFEDTLVNPETTLVNSYSIISEGLRDNTAEVPVSNLYINLVGHMLGLENLEDTNATSSVYARNAFGYKDMMAGAVGDHSAFSKYQLGWIEPKLITANSLPEEGLEVSIVDLTTSGDALLLYTGNHSRFGEYLLVDMYHPDTVINKANTKTVSPYGVTNFGTRGVRVTKVDARLVRGYSNTFVEYNEEMNFADYKVLPNGEKIKYVYDYAYTNSTKNKYYNCGITSNYFLACLLSSNGQNRHLTSSAFDFTSTDLFKAGSVFGASTQIEGFYKNFRFDGEGTNGPLLNISFEVKEFINNKAKIKLWREN